MSRSLLLCYLGLSIVSCGGPSNFDTYIYWGSPAGFSASGPGLSTLPANTALKVTIVGG